MADKLSDVIFKDCLVIERLIYDGSRVTNHYMIGTYDSIPFYMTEQKQIYNWESKADLNTAVRRKIIRLAKTEFDLIQKDTKAATTPQPQSYYVIHDITNLGTGSKADDFAVTLINDFYNHIWLKKHNNIVYMPIKVPFNEKNEAHALGAVWNGADKTWMINSLGDLKPFARWLPETEEELRP